MPCNIFVFGFLSACADIYSSDTFVQHSSSLCIYSNDAHTQSIVNIPPFFQWAT